MPGGGPKFFRCVLCNKFTKPKERKRVNNVTGRVLKKCFMIEQPFGEVICNKCAHKCYALRQREFNKHENAEEPCPKIPKVANIASPPSVTLNIWSTSTSHSCCFICKKPGPKLVVVQIKARFIAYIRKEVFIPPGSRCCPGHMTENGLLTVTSMDKIQSKHDTTLLNKSTILDLLKQSREYALSLEKTRLDFDNACSLNDDEYRALTGLDRQQFEEILKDVKDIKASKSRSIRSCVAILLTKLRTALDNTTLGILFNMSKAQVRRAVASARQALMASFVPKHLGFDHISREEIIDHHTRPLAKELLVDDMVDSPAILVLDGTYIYIQKSGNFAFQRRSYSLHKHRALVKPMMVVSTSGYVVSVLGPYLAKNNDATILNHIIKTNEEEMREWIHEGDIFVVDRGFRDSEDLLKELGIRMEMPAFLKRGSKQHTTEESNNSRLITKVRWVVESVNGRIKSWKYLDKTLPNTQIPFVGDFVRIVCAVCNKFRPALSNGNTDQDLITASKMRVLKDSINQLQCYVETNSLERKSHRWKKMDADDAVQDFPRLTEDEVRELTMGVYQVKLAKSYTHEHLNDDGDYDISVSEKEDDIICAKIQSRHTTSKRHMCWVQYKDGHISSWYCRCKCGARVVGTCAHVTSVIWYLAYARHEENIVKGVRDWSKCLNDASEIPDVIDESDTSEPEE